MRFFTAAALALVGVSAFAASPVPRPARELDIAGTDGHHLLLSQYKGKVVLIQFLLTTCPHCQAMSEMVTGLQHQFGMRGFQALGAAVNTAEVPLIKQYIDQHHVGFTDPNVRLAFPQVVLIDKQGRIQAQSEPEGTEELQEQASLTKLIEKLLAAPAAGAPAATKKAAPATPAAK
jgi:glutathione peroxidase-family protein